MLWFGEIVRHVTLISDLYFFHAIYGSHIMLMSASICFVILLLISLYAVYMLRGLGEVPLGSLFIVLQLSCRLGS